jgi:hypothetical protein
MDKQIRKKILAAEMVALLIVSGSIGYTLLSQQGESSLIKNDENNDSNQNIIKTTEYTGEPLEVTIEAGPIIGYEPLTVHFFGNTNTDDQIVSYSWEFGPKTLPIIPATKIHNFRTATVLTVLLTGITFLTVGFQMEKTMTTPWLSLLHAGAIRNQMNTVFLGFLTSIVLIFLTYSRYARVNSQYTSTERDPTMIFLSPGSYSATLTVTDTQGNTASDTIWITVLQYLHPDND